MASFDYHLNPLYAIKECSSCGALYTTDYCCSKGSLVDKIIRERPPQNCATCGDPVDGLYCRPCVFVRKCLNEGWHTIHDENEILNTFESSNDNTNIVSAPQEPFVFNQDLSQNSSRSPPHIDHHCCYEYGDSSDDIFCQQCTCKYCGKDAHYGYNYPPQIPIISNSEPCYNQNLINHKSVTSNNHPVDELPQTLPRFDPTCYSERENSLPYVSKPNFVDDSPNVFNPPPQPPTYSYEFCGNDAYYEEQAAKARYWKIPVCYDDDDDEERSIPLKDTIIFGLPPCVAITPALSTEEPVDSLIMEDEHLDTIPKNGINNSKVPSVKPSPKNPSESEDSSISKVSVICPFV
ncbi:hypothetical protein Tco_0348574 [Tanacetum coccineum]